jgi:hypothetical protein
MVSPGPRIVGISESSSCGTGGTDMDEQERADLAEAEAIVRYRAMRDAWGTCWGRRPR